jgi:hypothetical protein
MYTFYVISLNYWQPELDSDDCKLFTTGNLYTLIRNLKETYNTRSNLHFFLLDSPVEIIPYSIQTKLIKIYWEDSIIEASEELKSTILDPSASELISFLYSKPYPNIINPQLTPKLFFICFCVPTYILDTDPSINMLEDEEKYQLFNYTRLNLTDHVSLHEIAQYSLQQEV